MPALSNLSSSLSKADWKKLEDFLDGSGGPNLDTSLGFTTAIATAPNMIPPSVWLPTVLADRPLDSRDDSVLGLVLRLYNEILHGLTEESVYHPDADRVQQIADWCIGYMMGVDLHEDVSRDVGTEGVVGQGRHGASNARSSQLFASRDARPTNEAREETAPSVP